MLNSQNAKQLLSPNLPILNSKLSILITLMIVTIISFLPWISFTSGNGLVTAINPNERVQPITAPISGFVQTWSVKEGSFVRKGDLIATLTDNDPEILERIARELEASKNAAKSAKLAMDTSLINLERQEKLFEQGLTSRKNFEKAKIDYSKLSMEYSKALATQTKVETPSPVLESIKKLNRSQPCGFKISSFENCAASALFAASIIALKLAGNFLFPP